MNMYSKIFFLVATTVVGTVSVAAEPCASNDGNYGQYDMTACNFCAEHGATFGQCCDSIYRNSLGRSDDFLSDSPSGGGCISHGTTCDIGKAQCTPGLVCKNHQSYVGDPGAKWCDYPLAPSSGAPPQSLVTNSSSTSNDTGGSPAIVVIMVGLLGAAMLAMKVVKRRSSVAFRRDQYSTVEATPPIQV